MAAWLGQCVNCGSKCQNTENTEITSKIKENRKSNTEITEITSKMKGFQLFDSMLLYFTCDFDVSILLYFYNRILLHADFVMMAVPIA